MPNPETLHGDEEAIETCSLRFYELLDPHFDMDTGALDLQAPAEAIELTHDNLLDEGYTPADVKSAFVDAVQTLSDKKQIVDYL